MPEPSKTTLSTATQDQISPDGSLESIKSTPEVPTTITPPGPTELPKVNGPQGEVDKGAKVDPNAPPAETEGDVDVSDFEMAKVHKAPAAKTKPSAKDEQQKLIDDNKVQPVVDPNKKLDSTKPAARADKTEQRDLSDLPPELAPHFRAMSNEAYNTLKPLVKQQIADLKQKDETIKQLQTGKVVIPESYYENENAFLLTPDYQEAAVAANEAQIIYNHFKTELNNVRQGAKEYRTLARNEQGQLTYGKTVPADASAETDLMSEFNAAHNQLLTFSGKLQSVQDGFKQNYQQAKGWLIEQEKAWFAPGFQDEKTPLSIAAKTFLSNLPPTFRNNPLAPLLAKAMTTSLTLGRLLQEASSKTGNGNGQPAKPTPTRQPNETDLSGGEGGDGKNKKAEEDVTIDDFMARKEGRLSL